MLIVDAGGYWDERSYEDFREAFAFITFNVSDILMKTPLKIRALSCRFLLATVARAVQTTPSFILKGTQTRGGNRRRESGTGPLKARAFGIGGDRSSRRAVPLPGACEAFPQQDHAGLSPTASSNRAVKTREHGARKGHANATVASSDP